MRTALPATVKASIDDRLAETDRLLATAYPGDDGSRQPVHTVYVRGDTVTPDLPSAWGDAALAAAESAGGLEALALDVGVRPDVAAAIAPLVEEKLSREPMEDLRIDFEDGYGDRGDDAEDADVVRAAEHVAAATAEGTAPPFIGIRFKSFEAATRARGIRSLDLFVTALVDRGGLPDGLALTLPKVSTLAQVEAMADAATALERALGLPDGRLRFEVQVETPQLVLGADGVATVARIAHVAPGRIAGLHFGTYDYSAALGIAAPHQSLEHPAADHAKQVMQVAVAGTGIRLSDGSSNVLPIGDGAAEAWRLHARLVRRSLERGFPQGWDLHPAQLPTRFIATYAYYRDGWAEASGRLRHVHDRTAGAVLDEPATVRALAGFVLRGVQCGAITAGEAARDTGLDLQTLARLANPRRTHEETP
ncbi:DUF6986 family protein [Agromyces kandeliae]|uniref:Aldolase n=1 Tax=Agromyces kandeliae TaxID=2666141 RepID=A0A6L5R0J7_9MICO|nr:aldolase/citrate lyase family protein [Agromyces kandeliae]MRX43425.1 aldolase [Agromyces kandeliae]